MADFPFLGKAAIYYIVLFFGYYFLFYRYFNNTLDQQLLGLKDTLLLTFALILYLLIVLIPVYLWGRKNCNHPIWSGVEMFLCYAFILVGFERYLRRRLRLDTNNLRIGALRPLRSSRLVGEQVGCIPPLRDEKGERRERKGARRAGIPG